MKKKSPSQSAFFNLRVLIGLFVVLAGVFLALLGFGTFSNASAQAQDQKPTPEQIGLTTVFHALRSDLSRPLREQPLEWPPRAKMGPEHEANLNPKIPHKHVDGMDPVIQSFVQALITAPSIPSPILTWAGIPFPGVACNCAPPDPNGDVGKTQYVQIVNLGVQVFNKTTGASLFGPVAIHSLWAGFGGVCETAGSGDPVVIYDPLADRWVISQFAVPAGGSVPQDECMAVSQTNDATGAYYRYQFHLTPNFLDYPKLGVWPDGYYMSANIFNTSGTAFLGPQAFVFDRTKMLVGNPSATSQTPGITGGATEETFLPADLDGLKPPPVGAANPFVEWPSGSPLVYKIYKFHVDFTTPANTTFTLFASPSAAAFTLLCPTTRSCVPQLGVADRLDAIADRLMFRNAYRNINGGTLVNNYTVSANAVAGIRWFELRNVNSGPVTAPFQESTYQPDAIWRWMGSVAQDNQGNLALGFSASSFSIYPQLRYAGRLATDPLNTLSGEQHLFDGAGSQSDSSNRWGDYSSITVDPVDDCTFYYTNEYYDTTSSFNWRTRIGYFKFAQCTAPAKGTAHFVVTVCDGGAALANASVSIDGRPYGATKSNGTYDAALGTGNHTYSVSKALFGTVSGTFTITNGSTTNVPVCLQGTPVIVAKSTALVNESCSPANGVIDPGETVTVTFSLKNTGGGSTSNLVATLKASGGITPITTSQNYGVIAVGATVGKDFSFVANGACGGTITATLQLQDGAKNLGTVSFTLTLGKQVVVLTRNFDSTAPPALPPGWVATQGVNAGGFPFWVTSNSGTPTPVADSPPNAAYSVDPSNVLDNRLDTPSFTYTGAAQVTFRQNFDLEQADANTAFDCGVLEISNPNINGGAFTDIITAGGSFVTGGYNHTAINGSFANPCLPSRPNWSGVSGGFITATANLPAAGIGQPSKLRWRMCSDNSVSHAGWRVDNVTVIGGYVCCTSPAEAISTPTTPSGPASGSTGTNYTYSTGGSTSNLGHPVQYRFDWGDGSAAVWLPVGTTSAQHSWTSRGTYLVKSRGRCSIHTSVVSNFSNTFSVTIAP